MIDTFKRLGIQTLFWMCAHHASDLFLASQWLMPQHQTTLNQMASQVKAEEMNSQ